MATAVDTIMSKPRVPGGKGAARKLRASGWVPAVAYGPGSEPRHLAVDPKSFLSARMEFGVAHIYDVEVEGDAPLKVLIKSVERDPVSRQLLNIDLFTLDLTKPIRIPVRVELVGRAKGVVLGGLLQQTKRRVEIICLPKDIPAKLEVDVSAMEQGDSLHLSDIPLPAGVKFTAVADESVAILTAPEEEAAATPEEGGVVAPAAAEPEKKD